jgi:beta-glucosidase
VLVKDGDFRNKELDLEARVNDLLARLTLDEKMSLCAGKNFWETKPIPRLGLSSFRFTDGPRGVAFHSSRSRCTSFPSGIALGASFDPELAYAFGVARGEETRACGRHVVLGPAVNICRTPLNGRTFEYLTEDPCLNKALTVQVVKGVQSQKVAACVKHYAANNQETQRFKTSAEVSERALREIYLPAFEGAVKEADVWSVMAAYNAVNGVAACESKNLLKDKLREEYGFRGFVVSDWFAARRTTSSEACIRGGLTLEMPGKGSRYREGNLRKAFSEGRFTETELDQNLVGLLRVMFLIGHLDDTEELPAARRNTPEHQALARRMAAESMVLLKNETGLLPLDPSRIRKVAILGPKAKRRNCLPLWGGSSGVWPPYEIKPDAGIRERAKGRFEIVKSPADADAVLLLIGLSHRPGLDSEVMDRKSLELPAKQTRLIEQTVGKNPNTIVVLISGSPVTMDWADRVPTILEAWYPGMEGGSAIADVLFGDVNPSGKLPVTFPRRLEDSPAHRSPRTFPGDGKTVHYDEGVFVGYRHFDSRGVEPLFPFGHGLSYTDFDYERLQLSSSRIRSGDTLVVSVEIRNAGQRAGAEVVQLYLGAVVSSVPRPDKELKGFRKVVLEPGERSAISFDVNWNALAYFCEEEDRWVVEPGSFRALVGSSSRDIRLVGDFEVEP